MKRHIKNRLKTINGRSQAKDMEAAVRQLKDRQQDTGPVAGIIAESLSSHYTPPINKKSVAPSDFQYIFPQQVFQILNHLHPTATGLA
jgi:hypothetical protein